MASESSPQATVYTPESKDDLQHAIDAQDTYKKNHFEMPMDGGFHAWATMLGGFIVTTVTFGYVNAFGVYQDIYTRSGAASASRISWVGSTQLFILLAMGLPAGKLLDMGYFRYTNIIGSVIFLFSLFMVSLAHHDKYYQIYLSQGLGIGIGAGMLYVPAMAIQAHHWRARRALAMGIVVAGTSIGGIIFPIMLNQLFKGPTGFAWGVRASAFLCLGLLVLSNVLMTTNPAFLSQNKPKPDLKNILTDVPYMLGALAALITLLGLFFPYFYLQLYAIVNGIDENTAFYTLAVMNATALFGRIIPNIFTDKLGPINAIVPSTFGSGVLVFAMFGVKNIASTMVFAVLYGVFSGAFLSLCAPMIASLSRDPGEIGLRFGLVFFIASFGALTGPPIVGALLGPRFLWYRPIIFSGVTTLAGAFLFLAVRQMVSKRKGTQFV